jgi:hypothetical protein
MESWPITATSVENVTPAAFETSTPWNLDWVAPGFAKLTAWAAVPSKKTVVPVETKP